VPYRRKKLSFAISSPDEFLYSWLSFRCWIYEGEGVETLITDR